VLLDIVVGAAYVQIRLTFSSSLISCGLQTVEACNRKNTIVYADLCVNSPDLQSIIFRKYKFISLIQECIFLCLEYVNRTAEGEHGGKLPEGLKPQWASHHPMLQGLGAS